MEGNLGRRRVLVWLVRAASEHHIGKEVGNDITFCHSLWFWINNYSQNDKFFMVVEEIDEMESVHYFFQKQSYFHRYLWHIHADKLRILIREG